MEIPVIHEGTSPSKVTPKPKSAESSAPYVTRLTVNSSKSSSISSSSSTNHVTQVGKTSSSSSALPSQTREATKQSMHKEEVVVTPNKPRTPIKTAVKKAEDNALTSTNQSLHTRLPSTDSGIQADGGFDSLSRYRGKTFLSASSTNDCGYSDSPSSTGKSSNSSSGTSSGYSSDQSSLSNPPSLSSRVISLPSQSFFSTPKPVTSRSSSPGKSTTSGSRVTSSGSTTVVTVASHTNSSQSTEIHNAKPPIQTKPLSQRPNLGFTDSAAVSTNISKSSGMSTNSSSANQTNISTKTVSNERSELSTSVANRKPGQTTTVSASPRTSNSESGYMKMSPSVKVVSNDSSVKVSFGKNAITISSSGSAPSSSSSSTTSSSTAVGKTPPPRSFSPKRDNLPISHTASKAGTTTLFSAPGSTLRLQVNPTRWGQGQQEVKPLVQGGIALTRPLRLGAPAKPTVNPVPIAGVNKQSATSVKSVPLTQQQQQRQPAQQQHITQQQQSQVSSSVKAKPKIAPRPSVPFKPASGQPQTTSTTTSNTTTSFPSNKPTVSPASSKTASRTTASPSPKTTTTTTTSQSGNSNLQKSEQMTVNGGKFAGAQPIRKEIPVTHVTNRGVPYMHRTNLPPPPPPPSQPTKPTSFFSTNSRFTPEREKIYGHHTPLHKQPIYENVQNIHFDIRDGFSFDDPDTKMRHAELILKQSDELINDALKMLSSSPTSSSDLDAKVNGFSSGFGKYPEGERVVEGADATVTSSEREYTVPIFDVKSGKFHTGSKISSWKEEKTTSSGTEGKTEVTWKERKERIDSALSYLKNELAGLRDMDNTLISQFKRCQDTIETLKSQREIWEGLSEEGEDGDYWDDGELMDFNRHYLDSPGGSSCSQFSPGSRDSSVHDVTTISVPVPQLHLPSDRRGSTSGMKQDVEATL